MHQFARYLHRGIPSYISGGLGAPLTASGPEHAFHHFLVLDVSAKGIDVEVVRHLGQPSMGKDDGDDD